MTIMCVSQNYIWPYFRAQFNNLCWNLDAFVQYILILSIIKYTPVNIRQIEKFAFFKLPIQKTDGMQGIWLLKWINSLAYNINQENTKQFILFITFILNLPFKFLHSIIIIHNIWSNKYVVKHINSVFFLLWFYDIAVARACSSSFRASTEMPAKWETLS